jgi:hypothetical protein
LNGLMMAMTSFMYSLRAPRPRYRRHDERLSD